MLNDKIRELIEKSKLKIDSAENGTANDLQKIKSEVLGKNSEINGLMKNMRDIPAEDRPAFGQMVNEARKAVEEYFAQAEAKMKQKALRDKIEKEKFFFRVMFLAKQTYFAA